MSGAFGALGQRAANIQKGSPPIGGMDVCNPIDDEDNTVYELDEFEPVEA